MAAICTNGHINCDSLGDEYNSADKFCPECGAPVIMQCPHCNSFIRGAYIVNFDCLDTLDKPDAYCFNCGEAYPWTDAALKNAILVLQEEADLSPELKESTSASLPDIITETPGTNLAIIRLKKCLSSAGKFTSDALRQFVIDFGCELAKRSLGL